MPYYRWEYELTDDEGTKKTGIVEVHRPFKKFDEAPTRDEVVGNGDLTDDEFKIAKWEKIVATEVSLRFGQNWGPGGAGGSKGRWGK